MKILYEIPEHGAIFKKPVITMGTFDGVHSGHKEIFKKLLQVAGEKNTDPWVMTFDAHPRKIINPATPPRILTTVREKVRAMADSGIENVIMLRFTKEIENMHAIDFLNDIIIKKIGITHLVLGYDHAFGKDREGDYEFLSKVSREKDFGVTRVEPLNFHSRPVSSTWIRAEIEDGNIALANFLLGREYSLIGAVARGDGRGAELGFPTANIVPEDYKVIPKDGVYAVNVVIDNQIRKEGMINIGTNPTFSKTERTLEVNIFEFNKNIYGKTLEIDFLERIRDEIKFDTSEALTEQIRNDKLAVQAVLREKQV